MVAYSKPSGFMPMLFALFVLLQAVVAVHHSSHQQFHRSPEEMKKHYEDIKAELEKRQSGNYVAITGITPNSARERVEIRDLKNNADQWNLYLLGMERFKAKPMNDRLSYYQIAGVHGRPFTAWNNNPLVNRAGYCPHAQNMFPTWHRPYLALFEQALYQNIQEVINTFPSNQQQRWRNAAANFRMPFWDWARNPGSGPVVPTTMRDQTVTVTKPQGQVSIANPLYSYTWGNSLPSEMGGGPWNNFATTLRRPVSNPTRSNNNEMNARFNSIRISLANRIANIFSVRPPPSFADVSTSQAGARIGNSVDSFESIHDAVHVTSGGESGGHMYYLDYSAFDPLFWLHHTNVDRLLAMYQVTTSSYVGFGSIIRPMAQWNVGEVKNSNSPLKPFTKNTRGDFYTSNEVRSTTTFGYYYADSRPGQQANTVYQAIRNLYGAPTINNRKRSVSPTGQYEGRDHKKGEKDYILSVTADKYALPGSYSIHCFLGGPGHNSTNTTAPYPISNTTAPYPTNSTTTPYPAGNSTDYADMCEDPNYIGNYAVLGMIEPNMGNSTNPLMTQGALPLTYALQGKEAAGELKSCKHEDVIPYLKKNLYCRVIGPGNTEIPADSIPNLHLGVKACDVEPAKPGELPGFYEYKPVPEVTEHMPAGEPYTFKPTPIEEVHDDDDKWSPVEGTTPYPTGSFPYPTAPESEEGYCKIVQTIQYVDPSGNFLYEEMPY